MTLKRLIEGLAEAHVWFVIVGMVAGQLHGSRTTTYDRDIVYERSRENVIRLVDHLRSLGAYVKETWPNEGVTSEFSLSALSNEKA